MVFFCPLFVLLHEASDVLSGHYCQQCMSTGTHLFASSGINVWGFEYTDCSTGKKCSDFFPPAEMCLCCKSSYRPLRWSLNEKTKIRIIWYGLLKIVGVSPVKPEGRRQIFATHNHGRKPCGKYIRIQNEFQVGCLLLHGSHICQWPELWIEFRDPLPKKRELFSHYFIGIMVLE